MILAIAPNPSIDRAVTISGFRLGEIHRPQAVLSSAGGKGLNVARSIRCMGGEARVCTLLGGHNGRWIAEQLSAEDIPCQAAWFDGETRISTSIIDPLAPGRLTEIYERGERVSLQSWLGFEETLARAMDGVSWATFSGSLPPGGPQDGMARLAKIVRDQGASWIVDARDRYLRQALDLHPALVKVNGDEAGELLGRTVGSSQQALEAAGLMREMGAGAAIVTLGAQGAAAVSAQGACFGYLPPIQAVAAVGSGDAFLGGLVLGLSRGERLPEALRRAIAAGAANAMTVGAGRLEAGTVTELLAQVRIT